MTITKEAALAIAATIAEGITLPTCDSCRMDLVHISGTGGCGGRGALFACIPCDKLYVQMSGGIAQSEGDADLLEWAERLSQTRWGAWAKAYVS